MLDERKYIVAAKNNSLQISVRNILNPVGYIFLDKCSDAVSFMRLIRNYHPDFVIVDLSIRLFELRNVIETINDEMLCACIIVGEYMDMEVTSLIRNSKVVSFYSMSLNKDMLLQVVEMANLNFDRVSKLNQELKEMTENYESRKAIERAKWILIECNGISEQEAYQKMRKKSMDSRMSMKAIAEAVILSHAMNRKYENVRSEKCKEGKFRAPEFIHNK